MTSMLSAFPWSARLEGASFAQSNNFGYF